MSRIPDIQELKELYRGVMDNHEITVVSNWKQKNNDGAMDEEAYLNKAIADSDAFFKKADEALNLINNC